MYFFQLNVIYLVQLKLVLLFIHLLFSEIYFKVKIEPFSAVFFSQ